MKCENGKNLQGNCLNKKRKVNMQQEQENTQYTERSMYCKKINVSLQLWRQMNNKKSAHNMLQRSNVGTMAIAMAIVLKFECGLNFGSVQTLANFGTTAIEFKHWHYSAAV